MLANLFCVLQLKKGHLRDAGSDGDNDPFQEASLDDCEAGVKSPIGMVLEKTVVI